MPKVTINDTEFSVHKGELPWNNNKEGNPHWENFLNTMKFLGSIGFYVSTDKEVKKRYPTLSDTHREGGFADLRFKADYNANTFRIVFYQDVYHENPHGGYYDLGKYEKMPYLIRKRFDWTLRKLTAYFEDCGFTVERKQKYKGADFIVQDYIESRNHPQDAPFDLSEIDGQTTEGYNGKDANEKTLHNGDVKYFRDFNGYLCRGKVYHNINNMWWVLLADGTVKNKADFDLCDLDGFSDWKRKVRHVLPKEYMNRKHYLSLCSTKELENELKHRKRLKKEG